MAKGIGVPAVALLVTGCATVPSPEAPYEALGTEPFWSIKVDNGRMTYDTPNGGFSVPAPPGERTVDGRFWRTRRITLRISRGECRDGMSDRVYADNAHAVVDGQSLEGCGGAFTQPE